MIRYTVVWVEDAQDELAELWTAATDRDAVTTATHAIDKELAEDPENKGVELSEGLRALYQFPLRVLFLVRDEDRIVDVLRVKRFGLSRLTSCLFVQIKLPAHENHRSSHQALLLAGPGQDG